MRRELVELARAPAHAGVNGMPGRIAGEHVQRRAVSRRPPEEPDRRHRWRQRA